MSFALICAASLLSGPNLQVRPFDRTEPGHGTYFSPEEGRNDTFRELQVVVRGDGTLTITNNPGSTVSAWHGRWTPSAGKLNVTISKWGDRDMPGSGTITMYDDQRWGSVDLDFSSPHLVRLRFKSIWSGESYLTRFRLTRTEPATGNVFQDESVVPLSTLSINLTETGRASIGFRDSRGQHNVSGIYSIVGRQVNFNFQQGPDLRPCIGTGTMTLNESKTSFERASVDFTSNSRRTRFTAIAAPVGATNRTIETTGSGTLEWRGRSAVELMGVTLHTTNPNGIKIEVKERHGATRKFSGTYRQRPGSTTWDVVLTASDDYGAISRGRGQVTFRSEAGRSPTVRSISLSGELKSNRLHIVYDARSQI